MGRPLLVIHGWSADHRYMMADLEPNFEESSTWQRIYFDLPGHGTTVAPDWLNNQTQMFEILTKFIEQVIGDQKFGVIGNSYGGYLSLGLVRKMPHRLLGVALLVPDLPDDLNNRQTTDALIIVEDMTLFGNLQSDEQWIPAGLVEHSQYALDEIRAHDMPGYRASDDDLLERLNKNYLLPVEVRHASDPFAQPSPLSTWRGIIWAESKDPKSLIALSATGLNGSKSRSNSQLVIFVTPLQQASLCT